MFAQLVANLPSGSTLSAPFSPLFRIVLIWFSVRSTLKIATSSNIPCRNECPVNLEPMLTETDVPSVFMSLSAPALVCCFPSTYRSWSWTDSPPIELTYIFPCKCVHCTSLYDLQLGMKPSRGYLPKSF